MHSSTMNQSFSDLIKDTYFDCRGRLSRSQFVIAVIGIKLSILLAFLFCPPLSFLGTLKGLILVGYALACTYGAYVIIIKRLHDIDMTGWFSLLLHIPFLNVLFFLYLILKKGDNGRNRFGPPVR